jgi:NTP pyrophosphatase (non-canonical NTP hydrolase)
MNVARCQQVSDDSPYRAFQLTRLLSEIVFEKYPNLCPACGEKPCKCPADRYNAEHRSPAYKQAVLLRLQQKDPWRNEINPVELERFVGMFGGIYGGAHYGLPLETIGFHFLEEIGEVANAIRLIHEAPEGELEEHLKLLRNEIADVLSWICSLVLKLRQYVGTGFSYVKRYMPDIRHTPDVRTSVTLSRIVWDFYAADSEFLRCNSCKARPCTEEMLDKTM